MMGFRPANGPKVGILRRAWPGSVGLACVVLPFSVFFWFSMTKVISQNMCV